MALALAGHPARRRAALTLCLSLVSTAALADTGTVSIVHAFTGRTDGGSPSGKLVRASDGTLYGTSLPQPPEVGGAVYKIGIDGLFTVLYTLHGGAEGSNPYGLVVGNDGNLYGVTARGGLTGSGTCMTGTTNGCGTIFQMPTSGGSIHNLYTFAGTTDGNTPNGLVEVGGVLYGTTQSGGGGNKGVLFRITHTGTYTVLHDFAGTDGARPYGIGTLIVGSDGKLYGTTSAGGNTTPCGQVVAGCGTVYQATVAGDVTTLHTFAGSAADGSYPFGITQGSDGAFYGTTFDGGAAGKGTIFKLTVGSGASYSVLYSFQGTTDGNASTGLVQASDSVFYGAATEGGTSSNCSPNGCGTLFKFSPPSTFTTLHNFYVSVVDTDGGDPFGLVFGTDGNLYGLTGGPATVFKYAVSTGSSSSSSSGGSSSSSSSSSSSGGSSSSSSGSGGTSGGGGGAAGVVMIGGLALAALRRRRRNVWRV